MSARIGRISWSKLGITVYDGEGSFICRIEHEGDCRFFNECIIQALKRISDEQLTRRTYKSGASHADEVKSTAPLDVGERPTHGPAVGSGHAEGQETAGEGAQEEAGEAVAPI